jgi:multiple sugar transport system substrate-binding protein
MKGISGKIVGLLAGSVLLSSAMAQTKVEINVWSGYPELVPFYKRVGEDLKKTYPGVTVNVLATPLRDYERKLAVTLPAGQAAEVIELGYSTAQRYLEANLFQQAPATVSSFVSNGDTYDKFFIDSASYKGKVYGIPLFRGQGALFYNEEMLKAAGFTRPPRTMEEFNEYAQKLTKRDANGNPTVSGWSMRLGGGGQGIAEKFWINLHQWGGSLLEQSADGKWYANYDSTAGAKTLQQYVDQVHKFKTVTPAMKADAEAFQLELTAMFIRESWVIADTAAKNPKLKYKTAPLPVGTIALPANLYVPSSVKGDKARMAWEFARRAVERANQIWMVKNAGWLPIRKDIDYKALIAEIPALSAFLNYPKGYTFFTLPPIAPIEEVLTRLAERLVRAYNDPKLVDNPAGIQAVLKDAATETNAILERNGILGKR